MLVALLSLLPSVADAKKQAEPVDSVRILLSETVLLITIRCLRWSTVSQLHRSVLSRLLR